MTKNVFQRANNSYSLKVRFESLNKFEIRNYSVKADPRRHVSAHARKNEPASNRRSQRRCAKLYRPADQCFCFTTLMLDAQLSCKCCEPFHVSTVKHRLYRNWSENNHSTFFLFFSRSGLTV